MLTLSLVYHRVAVEIKSTAVATLWSVTLDTLIRFEDIDSRSNNNGTQHDKVSVVAHVDPILCDTSRYF